MSQNLMHMTAYVCLSWLVLQYHHISIFTNRDLSILDEFDSFMRFAVASRWSCWGVLGVQPTRSNLSCRPLRRSVCFLVSCTRAGAHHCMTSWEASAGWLTMGLSTKFIGIFTCINSFETIWKLPVLKYNMLKPTQIVVICCKETGFDDWLTRSWLNLSNI